jgi:protein SCO1/2
MFGVFTRVVISITSVSLFPAWTVTAASAPKSATTQSFRLAVWPAAMPSPDFRLRDEVGHLRSLQDYRGRVVLMFFGFLRCPDACPAEMLKYELMMKRLGAARNRVQVLFVTLDPERDMPAELATYVHAFDPSFIGLTGDRTQIDDAAKEFNVQYARVAVGGDYTINHSTSTFVFDRAGHLRLLGSSSTTVADFTHDVALLAARQTPISSSLR